jgi:pilus assembly protein CpaE
MDMHSVEAPSGEPLLLTGPADEGGGSKFAAGRLPLMAFVDAETERVLQESSVLLGRSVIMRGGITKAIEYLNDQRSPQLLIVDISGVDMPLSQIHTLADVCEPGTNVVAVGDHNDVGLFRELVSAGVTDYLVKPLTRELLGNLIGPKKDGPARIGLKLGKVIAFVGARGGVGTTTLAANMAWLLANQQARRVALVDLDLQHGDCALLFNIANTPGFRDALANPLRLDHLLLERIMTKLGERLFLLGSEEPMSDNVQFTAAAVDTMFSALRAHFHYVIVDVPKITAPAYRRALEMADRRVIVVDPTMRSMRDVTRIAKLFEDSENTDRNMFVVNRMSEAGSQELSLKDIRKVLQVPPAGLIPFVPKALAPAANHAAAAVSKRGKYTDAVTKLARELSGRRQARKSWWRRPN